MVISPEIISLKFMMMVPGQLGSTMGLYPLANMLFKAMKSFL